MGPRSQKLAPPLFMVASVSCFLSLNGNVDIAGVLFPLVHKCGVRIRCGKGWKIPDFLSAPPSRFIQNHFNYKLNFDDVAVRFGITGIRIKVLNLSRLRTILSKVT